jgi:LmbE family N-acetylglucosaminyl deacetylase
MKALVIAPHPDDETLGCGGTLLRHRVAGDELHWVIVTRAQSPQWSEDLIVRKGTEVERVAKAYDMSSVNRLALPSTRVDTLPKAEVIDALRRPIESVRPDIVYLIHAGDVHTDHHAVFVGVLSVIKTFHMRSLGVSRILSYETLSSTEAAAQSPSNTFIPNIFHDIGSHLERKLEIMAMYHSEAQPEPMPRSPSAIRALARYRGASIGVEYAEAFMLIREIG